MSNLYFALRRKWLRRDVSSLRLGLGSWRETQQATSQRNRDVPKESPKGDRALQSLVYSSVFVESHLGQERVSDFLPQMSLPINVCTDNVCTSFDRAGVCCR
jgi:hypothetical protein